MDLTCPQEGNDRETERHIKNDNKRERGRDRDGQEEGHTHVK